MAMDSKMEWGEDPIAGSNLFSHAQDMKANQLSPGANPKPAELPTFTEGADSINNELASALSADKVVSRGENISENPKANPKLEKKHWREAEATLFGGVERESQMHPGTSLFKTEH
jgi:hypothetical protein